MVRLGSGTQVPHKGERAPSGRSKCRIAGGLQHQAAAHTLLVEYPEIERSEEVLSNFQDKWLLSYTVEVLESL